MLDGMTPARFPKLNRAYQTTFQPGRLTLGLVLPLDAYAVGAVPEMERHIELAQRAEALGFAALWLRDVPFNVPSFGDVGQMFDPFVYLGLLSHATRDIGLGVASVVLPLRHPAHVAKAAATADQLSGGRLLLGVASGDRPEEYPAMAMDYEDRGARFRDALAYIRATADHYPKHQGSYGEMSGSMDMLPKPTAGRVPILITGGSQQTADWIAAHGDGWMTYPRDARSQAKVVQDYRKRSSVAKPVMQSLYVDLLTDVDARPRPIHLGFQSGATFLISYLKELQELGINHVALNLRFNGAKVDGTLERLADEVMPAFHS